MQNILYSNIRVIQPIVLIAVVAVVVVVVVVIVLLNYCDGSFTNKIIFFLSFKEKKRMCLELLISNCCNWPDRAKYSRNFVLPVVGDGVLVVCVVHTSLHLYIFIIYTTMK